jgi:hypothetical protein
VNTEERGCGSLPHHSAKCTPDAFVVHPHPHDARPDTAPYAHPARLR